MFLHLSAIKENSKIRAKKSQVKIKKAKLTIIALGFLLFAISPISAQAQQEDPQKTPSSLQPLRVVTRPIEPFVLKQDSGKYIGFSIELWEEIAEKIGRQYTIYEQTTVPAMIDDLVSKKADIAVASLSITAKREKKLDFSQPFFESGLQILVSDRPANSSKNLFSFFASPALLTLTGLLLLSLIAAHIMWVLERRENSEMFPKEYWAGIWESFWWAAVTFPTVGYGDKSPKTVPGRLLAIVWMFSSLILVSYFTASITTALTVRQLDSAINGPSDLIGKRVATVRGTTAANYLGSKPIKLVEFDTIEQAYEVLDKGEVEAVVYDAPILRYYASKQGADKARIVGPLFEKQNYGFAVPEGSFLREEVNRALLRMRENGSYERLHNKWFGSDRE